MNDPGRNDIEQLLGGGDWFGQLPADLQRLILDRSVRRRFARGEQTSREGEKAPGFIAVLDGRVAILRRMSDEEDDLVYVGGPGFWYGEYSTLLDRPAIVTGVALTRVSALVLPRAEFHDIIAKTPSYHPLLARLLIERYPYVLQFLGEARQLPPEDRLRRRLADLAELRRLEVGGDETVVRLDLTQSQLSMMLGLSRPNLNTRLRRLQDEGWIELGHARIHVLDADGLRASVSAGTAGTGDRASRRRGSAAKRAGRSRGSAVA
jgi:CRP-like cAMP-binding protein